MKHIFKYIISLLAISTILLSSCLDDLDTRPLNDNSLDTEKVYSTKAGYDGVFAKCYASLILTGQKGPDGDKDVTNIDEGYSGLTRALFYPQVSSTDELIMQAGSGVGTREILYTSWNESTKVGAFPYYRLYVIINYCNEFLKQCTESKLRDRGLYEEMKNDFEYYRSEVRIIRAYCYMTICDLYGSAPFVDESMEVGVIPYQKTRKEIYDYMVSEAEDATTKLMKPGENVYARIDQVAGWFLLARIYLNAEVWAKESHYDKAYLYAKRVIDSQKYPLASDYRHIFLADNNTCTEIIWPLVQDPVHSPGHAGTNFLVKALANGDMAKYVGVNGTWGNVRMKTQLVNKFELSDQTFDPNDPWGNNKKDKRAQFYTTGHQKDTWKEGKPFENGFELGYASLKWRNVLKDGTDLNAAYTSIDYPLFRTADAYLMAAEAVLRGGGGSRSDALSYVNEVRDRAYMSGKYGNGVSGRITDGQLSLDFILDERARELHTELVRRTDLIRFDKFTKNYNWDWKGSDGGAVGTYMGKDVNDKYKLFPIPQDEFMVNPNLTQNPDFK